MKHIKYLSYLVRHKWYVMLACFRYGLYWQGIVHDWSKFLPSEWLPYAESFYGSRSKLIGEIQKTHVALSQEETHDLATIRRQFDIAWLKHQHRNPHHWQHWVLREDSGLTKVLPMPRRYLLEMLADWEGAGRAITGKTGTTPGWYAKNRDKIMLHEDTRWSVDIMLEYFSPGSL